MKCNSNGRAVENRELLKKKLVKVKEAKEHRESEPLYRRILFKNSKPNRPKTAAADVQFTAGEGTRPQQQQNTQRKDIDKLENDEKLDEKFPANAQPNNSNPESKQAQAQNVTHGQGSGDGFGGSHFPVTDSTCTESRAQFLTRRIMSGSLKNN
jgi:hypothetical protein